MSGNLREGSNECVELCVSSKVDLGGKQEWVVETLSLITARKVVPRDLNLPSKSTMFITQTQHLKYELLVNLTLAAVILVGGTSQSLLTAPKSDSTV